MLNLSWYGHYANSTYTWYVHETTLDLHCRYSVQGKDFRNEDLATVNARVVKLATAEMAKYITENEL